MKRLNYSSQEFLDLIDEYQRSGDVSIYQHLFMTLVPLAKSVALSYRRPKGVDLEDVISEAQTAIPDILSGYRRDISVKLSTYAYPAMYRKIDHYCRQNATVIRRPLPFHMPDRLREAYDFAAIVFQGLRDTASDDNGRWEESAEAKVFAEEVLGFLGARARDIVRSSLMFNEDWQDIAARHSITPQMAINEFEDAIGHLREQFGEI